VKANARIGRMVRLIVCIGIALGALARSAPARPPEELIDRVIAVVEDRALLLSELEMEYRRYLFENKITSLPPEEEARLRAEFLDQLVAKLLLAVHAEQVGITVSDAEIDDELERALEDARTQAGGDEAFERELERAGMTELQLRTQWREQIRVRRLYEGLMRKEFWKEGAVSEQEVRAYYREHQAELPRRPETVALAHILILPGSDEAAREAAKRKIEEIEKKIRDGMDFAEAAKQYSEDPSAKFGGSLGFIRLEDIGSPPFEEAARKLVVGEMSPPVLTRFGWHLILLEDVSGDQVKLRHILVKTGTGEADIEAAAERAEMVRQKLLDGADFAEMAAKYSDDDKTRDNGGVIEGEISLESLKGNYDYFLEMIKDLKPGEISPVIKEQDGFRIVKILSHTPARPYTFAEAKGSLEDMLRQQKLQQRVDEYVQELKKIYYVDVKTDAESGG
jgi:peptidyl-prolyl cis-trans isomerase SurA